MALSSNYTSTVPQGTQQINNTQQPINYNFQDIAALLAVNHVGFNTADTFGTHNFLNFVTQTADPITAAAEMALYTKAVSGDTNGVELFYRYPSNGSVLQLTGSTASSGSTGTGGGLFTNLPIYSAAGSGLGQPFTGSWQYLSNGILMMTWQVGNGYQAGANGATSPMTVYIPNSSNCYTTLGSSTMPTFTTAIYNLQIGATNPQAYVSPTTTQTNNAITIVNTTTALLYWTGTATQGTQGSVIVTAIGI
ncbi:hypothetical protein UFOVP9_11 [uncultured Caudovirales phage]|jgi:hypothetical protein|uniref:Uncharacterized protein n=1 Tax=uncultured Caudovirales phage TaxID=2100421 RepID=A0A6J5KIC5_9CAUD|nr:hypothetical protein UFOVP9_11 [uncultured Caudovirales phage]